MDTNQSASQHSELLSDLYELLVASAKKNVLKKAVLSKPSDNTIIKATLNIVTIAKQPCIQAEFFHKDNKVTHKNSLLTMLRRHFVTRLRNLVR